jgi:hypothetical protein
MKESEKSFLQETFNEVLLSVDEDMQYAYSGAFLTDEFMESFESKVMFLIDMTNKGLITPSARIIQ